MTFKEYLAERRAGNDAAGDFVRLAKADHAMPDATTWDELRPYLERRGDFDAVETGRAVWREYEAIMKKAGDA